MVGRHLMRHCNGVVVGAAPAPWGDPADFRKQIGLHDFYFGDSEAEGSTGKLGGIQQLRATRIALAMAPLPAGVRRALGSMLGRLVGLIVMAEDQPRPENRVVLDPRRSDGYGGPAALVQHRHSPRDRQARRALARRAAQILREMGAAFSIVLPVRTFSHAMGTVRMGEDPRRFPVAPDGRFRGLENLWIADASAFPTAGAVNPSLTISANALRVATGMVAGWSTARPSHPRLELELVGGTGQRAGASARWTRPSARRLGAPDTLGASSARHGPGASDTPADRPDG
jgi:choline dehydrogenase-like flavoprotein